MQLQYIFNRRRLLTLLSLLLCAGFFATTLASYFVSKNAIRDAIIRSELPLTSSNVYSEIQKDLVQPILVSSTMAHDTFLRDWVLNGEKDPREIAHYLSEIKARYGAFSSFFVSDRSLNYYTGEGILKKVRVDEPRDDWYFKVRSMSAPYEINVDPDLANKDALTIFINYRVYDFEGNYIGATGIGLTVDAVRKLITDYQQRFLRTIYFVDTNGKIVLYADKSGHSENDLHKSPGMGLLLKQILSEEKGSYQYSANGQEHLLNVSFIPELNWYLFVEKAEGEALAAIRKTLYANLAIGFVILLFVLGLAHYGLNHYQQRIEQMAVTDKLTGLLNRHACSILLDKLFAEYRRNQQTFSALLMDVDHFKSINDDYGHFAGDEILSRVAHLLKSSLRQSDIAVRWGGEEFLLILKACPKDEAKNIAEKLRIMLAEEVFEFGGNKVTVTMSIGVAEYGRNETREDWISRADIALLNAKAAGRNNVCVT